MDRELLLYRRRIQAWTLYDWANSAFATTVLAAVLPVYYSQVAGSTLPSPSTATAYWSTGLSISILLSAVIAPVLGTVSDIVRGKKLLLSLFAGLGAATTGLLALVQSGGWLLASLLFVLGRLGYACANVFYDSLLPHVARPEDRDSVSARGFAMGYLGGGLLLAANAAMIRLLPGNWGPRLSFLSVALWWTVFSLPLLMVVPEPQTLASRPEGWSVWRAGYARLGETLKAVRRYRELFKFALAFFFYSDGIGTIIGIAAIYGAELGLGSLELILALLLVQFAAFPFSLIFGSLPRPEENKGRHILAKPVLMGFVLFNLALLPVLGVLGNRFLPRALSGATPPAYASEPGFAGQGTYGAESPRLAFAGSWRSETVSAKTLGAKADRLYRTGERAGDSVQFAFNGSRLVLTYASGPDSGIWNLELDGRPLAGADGRPLFLNCYSTVQRYENVFSLQASPPGRHTFVLWNNGEKDTRSTGIRLRLASLQVLPEERRSSLGLILGLLLAAEAACAALAFLAGRRLFARPARAMTAKNSLMLALAVYVAVAVWGFFLDSVLDFWCLAWLVACVQGGSQALSRSLFAGMIPASRSGEFFGLFGILEKFAAILGPLAFAGAAALFGSSRPAVLGLILFFTAGTILLAKVNVEEGRRVALAEDERPAGNPP